MPTQPTPPHHQAPHHDTQQHERPASASRYHHPAMDGSVESIQKIDVLAAYVATIYHEYAAAKATQLIYCETVMVYHAIRRQLVAHGIPAAEIAFIQDYDSKTKKAKLFSDMNAGRMRVLLASKQSTGMNIQTRLIALHHLDCPWRPGDLEQREGRIVRQGNTFPEVMIFAYVTEGSFDSYRWQTIETKASFIEQMKRGDVSMREIEDLGDAVASAAEIKALASGNPLVMEKVKLDHTIAKLEAAAAGDREQRVRMRRTLARNAQERQQIEQEQLPRLRTAHAIAQETAGQPFKAALLNGVIGTDATTYTKRDAAGDAMLKVLRELNARAEITHETQRLIIGRYRGFLLRGTCSPVAAGVVVDLLFDHEGTTTVLPGSSMTGLTTAAGVFQSIQYKLQHIEDDLAKAHARITALAHADATCQQILTTPWPDAERLEALRQRQSEVDAALRHAGATEAEPPTAAEPPLPTEWSVMPDHAGAAHPTPIAAATTSNTLPAISIPMPDNRAAMAAAFHTLRGTTDVEPVGAMACWPPEAVAAQEPQSPSAVDVLVLPPITRDIPIRPKQPTLVFGQHRAPQAKAAKATATTPTPGTGAHLERLGALAEGAGLVQMSLFSSM